MIKTKLDSRLEMVGSVMELLQTLNSPCWQTPKMLSMYLTHTEGVSGEVARNLLSKSYMKSIEGGGPVYHCHTHSLLIDILSKSAVTIAQHEK